MSVFDTDENFIDETSVNRDIAHNGRGGHSARNGHGLGPVVIVHQRALDRECLAQGLRAHNPTLEITAVGSLDEARSFAAQSRPAAILLILGDRSATDQRVRTELQDGLVELEGIPLIVLADAEGPAEILAALEAGARGYVSTSASIKVLGNAIALAVSGGTFIPASCILGLKGVIGTTQESGSRLSDLFTGRQTAVANALKQGKPNKIIAYELNMCEATVKVHVRNIMKKLGATNRTEVAYKLTEMAA
jgi:DNA-binding NarL/FixJ family response regulator